MMGKAGSAGSAGSGSAGAAGSAGAKRRGRLFACGALLAIAGLWATGAPQILRGDALAIEYTGCDEIVGEGSVCLINGTNEGGQPPRFLSLRFHLPADARRLRVRTAGTALTGPLAADQLLTVPAPRRTGWIELRVLLPEKAAVWRLTLARRPLPIWLTAKPRPPATFVDTLRRRLPDAPPELRGLILRLLARPSSGKTQADLYRQAARAHHTAGQLLGEALSEASLASCTIRDHRFQKTRQILDAIAQRQPAAMPMDAKAALALAYYSATQARVVGDLRTALRELRGAAALAERLSIAAPWPAAIGQEQAMALQNMGRWLEATAIYERLERTPETAAGCDRVVLLDNHAWELLMRREALGAAGAPAEALPLTLLRRAQEIIGNQKCSDDKSVDLPLSLALAELQAGDAAATRAALAAADRLAAPKAAMTPGQRLWRYEIEARLARAEGRPAEALQMYDRLAQLSAALVSPGGRWLAEYGRALSYQDLGAIDKALAAYREAAALSDEQSLEIPIFAGRETFFALREAGTRSFLELLVRSGRADEALYVARRARSRVLRQLERSLRLAALTAAERERWESSLDRYRSLRDQLDSRVSQDWQMPADELARAAAARAETSRQMEAALDSAFAVLGQGSEALPPLAPGEVVLAYYELGAGKWVGFAAAATTASSTTTSFSGASAGAGGSGEVVRMAPFFLAPNAALPSPAGLARLLLMPFQDEIRGARRIRVLPSGALEEIDFEALPFGGDILLAAAPVVYGLDLHAAPAVPRRGAGTWRALILADSRNDLPEARDEAQAVHRTLNASGTGWTADLLPPATDEATLAGRLGSCDLFHYAGHAASAGAGSWESMLLLAHGTRLNLADLLALPRSPAWVVLAACDAARQPGGAPVELPTLAHAFLLAGAHGVIAAVRPVDDRAARDFAAELYRHWSGKPDLAARLRQTQLTLRAARPASGWQNFRLFEP